MALEILPNHIHALAKLANLYLLTENLDSANIVLEKLLILDPHNYEGENIMAKLYKIKQKQKKEIEEQNKYVKYNGKIHFLKYDYFTNSEIYFQLLLGYDNKKYNYNIIQVIKGFGKTYQSYCKSLLNTIVYSIEIYCGDYNYSLSNVRFISDNSCFYDVYPSGITVPLDDKDLDRIFNFACEK